MIRVLRHSPDPATLRLLERIRHKRIQTHVRSDGALEFAYHGPVIRLECLDGERPMQPGAAVYVTRGATGFVCEPVNEAAAAEQKRTLISDQIAHLRKQRADARASRAG